MVLIKSLKHGLDFGVLELLRQKFYPEQDDLTHWLSELEAKNSSDA